MRCYSPFRAHGDGRECRITVKHVPPPRRTARPGARSRPRSSTRWSRRAESSKSLRPRASSRRTLGPGAAPWSSSRGLKSARRATENPRPCSVPEPCQDRESRITLTKVALSPVLHCHQAGREAFLVELAGLGPAGVPPRATRTNRFPASRLDGRELPIRSSCALGVRRSGCFAIRPAHAGSAADPSRRPAGDS